MSVTFVKMLENNKMVPVLRATSVRVVMFLAVLFALSACEEVDQSVDLSNTVDSNKPVSYSLQVKPILSDRCFGCHGADEKNRKADLQLHTADHAYKALEGGGYAIVPGESENSLVYQRIISKDPDFVMPPATSHVTVTPYEAELIKVWIDQGAKYEKHWAYIPPVTPSVPDISQPSWSSNAIDRFTFRKMTEMGLSPSVKADKATLIRRAFLDITGLIPTPEQLDRYLDNDSEGAYESMLEDLFNSPRYGEKMASYWLELARYGDTHGYQDDGPRTMWPWRDWVINAFNDNMPFDQFMTEQLAGDLLENPTESTLIATGFNRNTALNGEGGIIPEEFRVEYIADKIDVTSTTFLGQTMGCARCHDHKYDPLSQKDYYKMFAFFNSTDEGGVVSGLASKPVLNLYNDPDHSALASGLSALIGELEPEVKALETAQKSFITAQIEEEKAAFKNSALDFVSNEQPWYFSFDKRPGEKHHVQLFANAMLVPGKFGNAVRLLGEGKLSGFYESSWVYPRFKDKEPIGISVWTRSPDQDGANRIRSVPVYAEKEVSDTHVLPSSGFMLASLLEKESQRGFDLSINERRQIEFSIINNWPGSAIQVVSEALPRDSEWHHVYAQYDGSKTAKGLTLFLNGKQLKTKVLKNSLSGSVEVKKARLYFGAPAFVSAGRYEVRDIDELRFLKEPIKPSVISELANASPALFSDDKNSVFQTQYLSSDEKYIASKTELLAAQEHLSRLEKHHAIPAMIMSDSGSEAEPLRPTYLLERGSYDKPDTSEVLKANIPTYFGDLDGRYPQNRLGLAQWLASESNPLTARVMVNRLWQIVFGRGIVNTSENFGNQGALPSHPELLDWLASEFVASGWDMKHMMKLMMMSSTYQQSSGLHQSTSEQGESEVQPDPENIYLSRSSRFRMSAEAIRDSVLLASGLLVEQLGGPSVKPYQPSGLWESIGAKGTYVQGEGDELYRRSLYSYWKRTVGVPSMTIFDASTKDYCVSRRQATNTPLQALVMLNDPQFVEAARVLAERAFVAHTEPDTRIDFMAKSLLSRPLVASEMQELRGLFEEVKTHFSSSTDDAKNLLEVGAKPVSAVSNDFASVAALAVVSSAIMNLSEFVTRQ